MLMPATQRQPRLTRPKVPTYTVRRHRFEDEGGGVLYDVTATYEEDWLAADDCWVVVNEITVVDSRGEIVKQIDMTELRDRDRGLRNKLHGEFIEFMEKDFGRWELLAEKASKNGPDGE